MRVPGTELKKREGEEEERWVGARLWGPPEGHHEESELYYTCDRTPQAGFKQGHNILQWTVRKGSLATYKGENPRAVSTHGHQVSVCPHTCISLCILTRQVLIQGKLGHVFWSSCQTHPEKNVPRRGEDGAIPIPLAVLLESAWMVN